MDQHKPGTSNERIMNQQTMESSDNKMCAAGDKVPEDSVNLHNEKINSSNNIEMNEHISESLENTMCAAEMKSPEKNVSLLNNVSSEKKRKKRNSINLTAKLEIIKAKSSGRKLKELAKEFGISRHSVRYIIKDKEKYIRRAKALEDLEKGKGAYHFDAGHGWVCSSEHRWDRKLVHDSTDNASNTNSFLMGKKFRVDDDHDQSQQVHRIDSEDASLDDTSNFNAPGNVEGHVSIDCESQQNPESNKCNINELEDYDSTLSYKLTFYECIRSLMDSDVSQHLSDNTRKELIKELHFLISTMTSTEHLLNDLLMNETWKPFGKFKCFGDVAWVYQLSNEIEERSEVHEANKKMVICTICYETLKDNGLMLHCNKEWRLDRLDYDFNLICRKCDVCFNTTLHSRPAAECIFCIIAFWKIKAIAESEFKNGTNREQH
ncbi:hypothetical protein KQX54_011496 [Cotesia glomerata]|uniref:HTH psq-type domain-containing protein n=1 Tax=Cotesia glomerata TaxID=32391 RepID=A0AAV7J2E1_COTGL|nr:hypothetical protein KQX54_011496 [Cotesia glomerata]